MTTIAYDTKSLVSDSQSSIGNMRYEDDCQKLHKDVGPFAILGIAGDFQTAMDIIEVIADYTKISQIRSLRFEGEPNEQAPTVHMIGITHEGQLWFYDGTKGFELRADRPYAIGSGSEYALGAMAAGASAKEAVIIAARYDINTNDVLQIAEINFTGDEGQETTIH